MSAGLKLVTNVLTPLAKRILIPLELMVAELATDTATHKKMFG